MRALIIATLALAFAACGGDDGDTKKDAGVVIDAPPPDAPSNCFLHPTTNDEIINACTTAQKIYKSSHPALLNADGTLPALP